MAPIRRYLRITQYSVLEVRIYLDQPNLGATWLLRDRDPVLLRVIEAVRPLVLPKLKEENERRRGKRSKSKKAVKDVVVNNDFEISVFLTDTPTRHSLVTKHKYFREAPRAGLKSNSSKLTGGTTETPIELDGGSGQGATAGGGPHLRHEDSDEDALEVLRGLPDAKAAPPSPPSPPQGGDRGIDEGDAAANRRSKRPRTTRQSGQSKSVNVVESSEEDNSEDGLFVSESESQSAQRGGAAATTAATAAIADLELGGLGDDEAVGDVGDDDKKKMAMDTSYDGFSIYGKILCLVVKKREGAKGKDKERRAGQAMMEEWITSTQMPMMEDEV